MSSDERYADCKTIKELNKAFNRDKAVASLNRQELEKIYSENYKRIYKMEMERIKQHENQ